MPLSIKCTVNVIREVPTTPLGRANLHAAGGSRYDGRRIQLRSIADAKPFGLPFVQARPNGFTSDLIELASKRGMRLNVLGLSDFAGCTKSRRRAMAFRWTYKDHDRRPPGRWSYAFEVISRLPPGYRVAVTLNCCLASILPPRAPRSTHGRSSDFAHALLLNATALHTNSVLSAYVKFFRTHVWKRIVVI